MSSSSQAVWTAWAFAMTGFRQFHAGEDTASLPPRRVDGCLAERPLCPMILAFFIAVSIAACDVGYTVDRDNQAILRDDVGYLVTWSGTQYKFCRAEDRSACLVMGGVNPTGLVARRVPVGRYCLKWARYWETADRQDPAFELEYTETEDSCFEVGARVLTDPGFVRGEHAGTRSSFGSFESWEFERQLREVVDREFPGLAQVPIRRVGWPGRYMRYWDGT